jgi:hypothetical protein
MRRRRIEGGRSGRKTEIEWKGSPWMANSHPLYELCTDRISREPREHGAMKSKRGLALQSEETVGEYPTVFFSTGANNIA